VTGARNRFSPPTSIQQLEDVLKEEWYKIPLQTVENFYESIPRRTATGLKAKVVQHHTNKEMGIAYVVFLLFCTTPVHIFQNIPFQVYNGKYEPRYILHNFKVFPEIRVLYEGKQADSHPHI
jgi:hypothetical protein